MLIKESDIEHLKENVDHLAQYFIHINAYCVVKLMFDRTSFLDRLYNVEVDLVTVNDETHIQIKFNYNDV